MDVFQYYPVSDTNRSSNRHTYGNFGKRSGPIDGLERRGNRVIEAPIPDPPSPDQASLFDDDTPELVIIVDRVTPEEVADITARVLAHFQPREPGYAIIEAEAPSPDTWIVGPRNFKVQHLIEEVAAVPPLASPEHARAYTASPEQTEIRETLLAARLADDAIPISPQNDGARAHRALQRRRMIYLIIGLILAAVAMLGHDGIANIRHFNIKSLIM